MVLGKAVTPVQYQVNTNNRITPPLLHWNINSPPGAEKTKVIKEKVTAAGEGQSDFLRKK